MTRPRPTPGEDPRLGARRGEMVLEQIARRGVQDPRVLAAVAAIPRHKFVDSTLEDRAYEDGPLPIGFGQTISQPYMVARATELAAPQAGDRALEVGAGCGYQTAVLARLCSHVFAVELVPELAARAAGTLKGLGIANATVEARDGTLGWAEHAPFDVILVSAGAPRIPPMLLGQLADGGRLVMPVGETDGQSLMIVKRTGDAYETTRDTSCRYVALRGRYGVGGQVASA